MRPLSSASALLDTLCSIVGSRHVLTGAGKTRRYRKGYRFGEGAALAVVRPGNLVEQWRVAKACIEAGRVLIMQAANTGLTGGSTPDGAYDREVVILSTTRMDTAHLIRDGRQVICLPGTTLYQLETLLKPLDREPHSVIGSSCIGASVIGGVCNNSGGSLIQRGPAFTQLALFGRVGEAGQLELVNHLGVTIDGDPETVLARIEAGDFTEGDIADDPACVASDRDYVARLRDIEADTPARYNADPDRLFEASGSAGKAVVFAVRLDTFPAVDHSAVFYIGTNDPAELTRIRRDILGGFAHLPIAGEYLHRDCYDIARKYGKDTFLAIRSLGTGRIGQLFAIKSQFDAAVETLGVLPKFFGDRLLQAVSSLFPEHLPDRMNQYRDRFEHHLMLKMSGDGVEEARAYLTRALTGETSAFFECTPDEGSRAFLHRFVAAGAAVRYRAVHHREVSDIVALDIALRRNDQDWMEVLPDDVRRPILKSLYYGHFFCHVFHQDYIVAKGHDPIALEHRMWRLLDQRRAAYPAEHNVGHLYVASPAQTAHFKRLDPCNCLNPGIGKTSRRAEWV